MNDKPEAYVTGIAYFYNEEYKVTPDVMIPRPDTERVVDKLTELLPYGGKFLDLCTGSGCIAVSALRVRKDCTADAVDVSEAALALASENARINGVDGRLAFFLADVKSGAADFTGRGGKYDVIVSNPPYIKTGDIPFLDGSVIDFEPLTALDGGNDGLDFYRAITENYTKYVKSGGYIIFEIGYDQAEDIKKTIAGDMRISIFRDYGGNDRVAVIYV